jgi:hypothetical protein
MAPRRDLIATSETYMRLNPAAVGTPAGTVCPTVKPSFDGRNASWFRSEVKSHLRDHLQTSFFKRLLKYIASEGIRKEFNNRAVLRRDHKGNGV